MNEEFQSANEELQSTNEELETSKEELQSLNEELVTVNAELQEKVEELNRVNSDMENLLTSSGIATLFLDRHLEHQGLHPGHGRNPQPDPGGHRPPLPAPGRHDRLAGTLTGDAATVLRDSSSRWNGR